MHRWSPLLEPNVAQRAEIAIESIAGSLRNGRPPLTPPGTAPPHLHAVKAASLEWGDAGMSILFTYLDDGDTAMRTLEAALQAMASIPMKPSLYSGRSGIAWTLQHLEGQLLELDEDLNASMDADLLRVVSESPWPREYDLVGGLVGMGVYALSRLPRGAAADCIRAIVSRLDELAETSAAGTRWLTPSALVPSQMRSIAPAGWYNLGLAHGIPGIVVFLAQVAAADVDPRARPLLDDAVEWLLARTIDSEHGATFPDFIAEGQVPGASRVAWCYGDLGVAAALQLAGALCGARSWEQEAIELAARAATRPLDETGVLDAGLCHGAAGAGHLFNRMYQRSGDARLAEAARFWFGQALEMRQPGTGIGGYRTRWVEGQQTLWLDDPGILTGSAGVALALHAAISDVEPAWDAALLLSPAAATL